MIKSYLFCMLADSAVKFSHMFYMQFCKEEKHNNKLSISALQSLLYSLLKC